MSATRTTALPDCAPVFDDLNRYEVTTRFNGQSTVTIAGNRATGESYTIAHHLFTERPAARSLERLVSWITSSKITGPAVHVLPMAQAEEAHRLLETGATTGKIVLRP
jgi:NADPH:quinone reductase-like Zn-dependent oxidoreductase